MLLQQTALMTKKEKGLAQRGKPDTDIDLACEPDSTAETPDGFPRTAIGKPFMQKPPSCETL